MMQPKLRKGSDENGCRVVKKGEVYERLLFDKKSARFKSNGFLKQIKESTDLINSRLSSEHSKLEVYRKDSICLPMKKIGKNNPKEKEIRENNRAVLRWNEQAAHLASRLPEEMILEIKRKEIVGPVRISKAEGRPVGSSFAAIVRCATKTLFNFYRRWIGLDKELRPKVGSEGFYWMLERQRAKELPQNMRFDRGR